MALAWPSYMPTVLRENYGFEQTDVVARTEMEGGPRRLRQIAPPGPETVPVSWMLMDDQMALFKTWFQRDALSGSARIDLPIRTRGQPVEVQTAYFISPISWRLETPRKWRASATVQIVKPRVYSDLEYTAAEVLGGESAFYRFADPIDRITNTDTPNNQRR